ncbi:hypothetical protein QCA50_013123 [Cerrena zonata]|uniref:DUF6534 domain-containing protein n=1 Tax=Cerrena zonata TaxID=2478898 RepID=A0AAW0FWQ5_9APHY
MTLARERLPFRTHATWGIGEAALQYSEGALTREPRLTESFDFPMIFQSLSCHSPHIKLPVVDEKGAHGYSQPAVSNIRCSFVSLCAGSGEAEDWGILITNSFIGSISLTESLFKIEFGEYSGHNYVYLRASVKHLCIRAKVLPSLHRPISCSTLANLLVSRVRHLIDEVFSHLRCDHGNYVYKYCPSTQNIMSFNALLVNGFFKCFAISGIFYGITVAQAYHYFRSSGEDARWIKWLAGVVMFLETAHMVVYIEQIDHYLGPAIASTFWTIPTTYALEIAIEILVNGFYIYRIWMLSKNITLVIGIVSIFIARIVTFLLWLVGVLISELHNTIEAARFIKVGFIATTSLAIVLDTITATTMVLYLRQSNAKLRRSQEVITWLLVYYVNTGAILASLSTAILVTGCITLFKFVNFDSQLEDAYESVGEAFLYAGLWNIFAKVLANSFFAVLNSRHMLRVKMNKPVVIDTNAFVGAQVLPGCDSEVSAIRFKIDAEAIESTEQV